MSRQTNILEKLRPSRLQDLWGNAAMKSGLIRLLEREEAGPGILFVGESGVGKSTTARIVARQLICEAPTASIEPCWKCLPCRRPLMSGLGFGEGIAYLNCATTSWERVAAVLEEDVYQHEMPIVVILEELGVAAEKLQHALLTALEDPDANLVVLATMLSEQPMPAPLRSRFIQFEVQTPSPDEMLAGLEVLCERQGWQLERSALAELGAQTGWIARETIRAVHLHWLKTGAA